MPLMSVSLSGRVLNFPLVSLPVTTCWFDFRNGQHVDLFSSRLVYADKLVSATCLCASVCVLPTILPDNLPAHHSSLSVPFHHTSVTVVIHQHHLLQQDVRRRLQHAVNRPQQGGPRLVVEGDDNGCRGQGPVVILQLSAAAIKEELKLFGDEQRGCCDWVVQRSGFGS